MRARLRRAPDGSVEVDLLVSESDQFDQLRMRAVTVTLDERTFLVASIDDLTGNLGGGPMPR